jgi:hypothetical protein
MALSAVNRLDTGLSGRIARAADDAWRAHYERAAWIIGRVRDDPRTLAELAPPEPPPGSPIGAQPSPGN